MSRKSSLVAPEWGGRERVLVIGDDMRIFLAVVRSMGRSGKEVHAVPFNWHSPALKSRYISKVHHLPRYSDDPAGWQSGISQLLREGEFSLVVPCCDRAIIPLHVHRNELGPCPIAIPASETMETLFNKERTREVCTGLGVAVAAGARLRPSDTAESLADRFGLPLVIKPRSSYFADRLETWGKVWVVESHRELSGVLANIEDHSRFLVESFFDGVGVGVSVIAKDGEIFQAFQHRRLRQGRGGPSSYRVSEPLNEELLDAARTLCRHTRLNGVCMFEFRFNMETRDWILIETNARFWGSMPLPLSLGVDFPRYLYDLLVLDKQHHQVDYPAGVRSRNVVLDGLNLIDAIRGLDRGSLGPWLGGVLDFATQPVRWATGRERSDTFVRDDLRPALWECAVLWKSLSEKMARSRGPEPNRRHSERKAPKPAEPSPRALPSANLAEARPTAATG